MQGEACLNAVAGKHGEYDIVLANVLPQVQDKWSSVTNVNEPGEASEESLTRGVRSA